MNYTLVEFLKLIANCDGGEAMEIVGRFQSNAISIEDIYVDELEDIE